MEEWHLTDNLAGLVSEGCVKTSNDGAYLDSIHINGGRLAEHLPRAAVTPLRILIAALSVAVSASAQTGSVVGVVVGPAGEALAGATVALDGTGLADVSGTDGRFRLAPVTPGTYTVVATRLGYRTSRSEVVVAGAAVEVRLALAEQPLDVGEAVVTALETLTGRGTLDLPGSGHFVGPRTLERIGGSDVHRVLREVPGVTIQEEDGYGLRPNIGLRGSGSERSSTITLMEDGVLISPAPYTAPAAYYFPTLRRMDGVEVRTGAGQIQYGPATTGGAVNLLAADVREGTQARGEVVVGPNNQRTLHARLGAATPGVRALGGFGVGAVAEVVSDNVDGFKTLQSAAGDPLLSPAGDRLDTGFEKLDLFGRVRITTPAGWRTYQSLTLTAGLTDEVSDETYLGLTDADFAASPFARYAGSRFDEMTSDHRALRLRHVAVLSSRLNVVTTAYRNAFARNWYKLDRAGSGTAALVGIAGILNAPVRYAGELAVVQGAAGAAGRLGVRANNRDYLSRGVQTAVGLRVGRDGAGARVEAGVRLHEDSADRTDWNDEYTVAGGDATRTREGVPGTASNRLESARAVAGFLQADVEAGRLTLTPGVRLESVKLVRDDYGTADLERTGANLTSRENTVTALIPGIGAVLDVGRGVRAFGGVHRGFAPPSSDPATRPEESVNTEIGVRVGTPAVEVQVAAYNTAYRNLLGSDLAAAGGTGTTDQFNGGRVRARGVEVGVTADAARLAGTPGGWAVPVRLAYTLTDARFQSSFASTYEAWGQVETGDALPYLARHQLYARAGVERAGWAATLFANGVSAMRSVAGQGEIPAGERVGAHVVFNASVEAPVRGGLALTAAVYNLADTTYAVARRPAGLRPGLPRTLTVGLRARLGR